MDGGVLVAADIPFSNRSNQIVGRPLRYPPSLRARAVAKVASLRPEQPSTWATIKIVAAEIDMSAETLRRWVHDADTPSNGRPVEEGDPPHTEPHHIRYDDVRSQQSTPQPPGVPATAAPVPGPEDRHVSPQPIRHARGADGSPPHRSAR